MQKFKSVEELVNQLKPEKPVYCIRKNSILSASKFFQKKFPGKILYAVKTNPHPEVVKTLIRSGINQFDVASIEEIKAVRKFDNTAKCSFMHTIKSPESIKKAYFEYGIKTFSLDTKEELIKIIKNTDNAKGVQIFIGSQNFLFKHSGLSMVMAPYKNKEQEIIGAIGVVGPTRLNYAKIVPLVDYTSKIIGKAID